MRVDAVRSLLGGHDAFCGIVDENVNAAVACLVADVVGDGLEALPVAEIRGHVHYFGRGVGAQLLADGCNGVVGYGFGRRDDEDLPNIV